MMVILICYKQDVRCRNTLNDNELFADGVATLNEGVEQHRKREQVNGCKYDKGCNKQKKSVFTTWLKSIKYIMNMTVRIK